jgi:hypothetical protein
VAEVVFHSLLGIHHHLGIVAAHLVSDQGADHKETVLPYFL